MAKHLPALACFLPGGANVLERCQEVDKRWRCGSQNTASAASIPGQAGAPKIAKDNRNGRLNDFQQARLKVANQRRPSSAALLASRLVILPSTDVTSPFANRCKIRNPFLLISATFDDMSDSGVLKTQARFLHHASRKWLSGQMRSKNEGYSSKVFGKTTRQTQVHS
jgi:hypothetical protein